MPQKRKQWIHKGLCERDGTYGASASFGYQLLERLRGEVAGQGFIRA
jgi:hypothetical protein